MKTSDGCLDRDARSPYPSRGNVLDLFGSLSDRPSPHGHRIGSDLGIRMDRLLRVCGP